MALFIAQKTEADSERSNTRLLQELFVPTLLSQMSASPILADRAAAFAAACGGAKSPAFGR